MRPLKLLATMLLVFMAICRPATTHAQCDNNCGGNYGTTLVTFDGVAFKSNGDCSGTCRGAYQCVTAVQDFYHYANGFSGVPSHVLTRAWGSAKYAFTLSDNTLTSYTNGATATIPQPGDILCFGTGTDPKIPTYTNYGHVAIVSKVTSDHVYIVDANRTADPTKENLPLGLTYSGGHYTVQSFSSPHYVTQGWLRNPGYVPPGSDASPSPDPLPVAPPTTYLASLSTQNPFAISLVPGQMAFFSVTYVNSGTAVWKGGSTSQNDANYVELRACNASGTTQSQTSWLYYSGANGWISNSRATTCDQASVAQFGTGTFTFTVQVPTNQATGTYTQYFRLHHNTGGDLLTPGGQYDGYHVTINVIPKVTTPIFLPLVGDFNGDGIGDVGIYDSNAGNWYVALGNGGSAFIPTPSQSSGLWMGGTGVGVGVFQPLVGDFNGDGKSDVCLYVPQSGTWYVALSTGSGFSFQGTPWMNGVAIGAGVFQPYVGDFNGDGKDDICIYVPSSGTWYVCLSNGASAFIFQTTPWMNGIAVGAGTFQPYVGDFNGDGKDDICIYTPSTGTWYACLSNGSTAFNFQSTPWMNGIAVGAGAFVPLSGDFDGDGKSDILIYTPSTGTWYACLSNGSTAFNFQSTPWMDGVAIGAGVFQPLASTFGGTSRSDVCAYVTQSGTWDVALSSGWSLALSPWPNGVWLDGWGVQPPGGMSAHYAPPEDQPKVLTFSVWTAPNPATYGSTINFTLPVPDRASVSIYDVSGREVTRFADAEYGAGQHSLQWNRTSSRGGRAASGVYFITFRSTLHSVTRRVVVLN